MNPDYDLVERAIYRALAPFDLAEYTDGVMDSLAAVIEWSEYDEEADQ